MSKHTNSAGAPAPIFFNRLATLRHRRHRADEPAFPGGKKHSLMIEQYEMMIRVKE